MPVDPAIQQKLISSYGSAQAAKDAVLRVKAGQGTPADTQNFYNATGINNAAALIAQNTPKASPQQPVSAPTPSNPAPVSTQVTPAKTLSVSRTPQAAAVKAAPVSAPAATPAAPAPAPTPAPKLSASRVPQTTPAASATPAATPATPAATTPAAPQNSTAPAANQTAATVTPEAANAQNGTATGEGIYSKNPNLTQEQFKALWAQQNPGAQGADVAWASYKNLQSASAPKTPDEVLSALQNGGFIPDYVKKTPAYNTANAAMVRASGITTGQQAFDSGIMPGTTAFKALSPTVQADYEKVRVQNGIASDINKSVTGKKEEVKDTTATVTTSDGTSLDVSTPENAKNSILSYLAKNLAAANSFSANFEKFYNDQFNSDAMKSARTDLANAKSEMLSKEDKLDAIRKDVEQAYAGTGMTRGAIEQLIGIRQRDVQQEYKAAARAYQASADVLNGLQDQAKTALDMYKTKVDMADKVTSQVMQFAQIANTFEQQDENNQFRQEQFAYQKQQDAAKMAYQKSQDQSQMALQGFKLDDKMGAWKFDQKSNQWVKVAGGASAAPGVGSPGSLPGNGLGVPGTQVNDSVLTQIALQVDPVHWEEKLKAMQLGYKNGGENGLKSAIVAASGVDNNTKTKLVASLELGSIYDALSSGIEKNADKIDLGKISLALKAMQGQTLGWLSTNKEQFAGLNQTEQSLIQKYINAYKQKMLADTGKAATDSEKIDTNLMMNPFSAGSVSGAIRTIKGMKDFAENSASSAMSVTTGNGDIAKWIFPAKNESSFVEASDLRDKTLSLMGSDQPAAESPSSAPGSKLSASRTPQASAQNSNNAVPDPNNVGKMKEFAQTADKSKIYEATDLYGGKYKVHFVKQNGVDGYSLGYTKLGQKQQKFIPFE